MLKDFECREESYAKEVLRERGLRSTSQRLAVIHVLHESGRSLSVGEIHDGVRGILGGTGLATIYRTLETFESLGVVRRLHFPDGESGYAFSRAGNAHHMVCLACRSVFDFPECPVKNFDLAPLERTGFRVKDHFVQFFGKCADCEEVAS